MHDTGFAPCIQNNKLTLGCCKPNIRRTAKKGDYIIAFYGKSQTDKKYSHALAYIAKVTKIMNYKQYYKNHKDRTDCIYNEKLQQLPNEFHNSNHTKRDLNGQNILMSNDFIFFGKDAFHIDDKYLEMIGGRGHKVRKNEKFRKMFPKYFKELKNKYGNYKLGDHLHQLNRTMHETKSKKRKLDSVVSKKVTTKKNKT
jgi:hypothetical protein